jgi:hypothetical protein
MTGGKMTVNYSKLNLVMAATTLEMPNMESLLGVNQHSLWQVAGSN